MKKIKMKLLLTKKTCSDQRDPDLLLLIAQLAGAVEYTDCFSTEG